MEAFNETSIISIPSDPAKFSAYAMGLLSKIQELEDKVCLLEKKRFGPSSEKFVDPNQPSLFNEAEATSAEDDDVTMQSQCQISLQLACHSTGV